MAIISAEKVHNGLGWLKEGAAIEVSDSGVVLQVYPDGHPHAESLDGVLVPGFVNAHCHVELSHMKGVVPKHTSLVPFLQQVQFNRNAYDETQRANARRAALEEMKTNGIVAVGDIANTADTLDIRGEDAIHFHTFVEAIGFSPVAAQGAYERAASVLREYQSQTGISHMLRQSITAHAPYSVSKELFVMITAGTELGVPVSVHNQESKEENTFFERKEGGIRQLLAGFGIDDSTFQSTGKSSVQSYGSWIDPLTSMMLVHNTYTSRDDVQSLQARFSNLFWCLCPQANLYIEDRLPDIAMLVDEGAVICIGTDSLASNDNLSILSELSTINARFPDIGWERLFSWATKNGAAALNMLQQIGTIEPGKQPGINLITGLNTTYPTLRRLY